MARLGQQEPGLPQSLNQPPLLPVLIAILHQLAAREDRHQATGSGSPILIDKQEAIS